MAGMLSRGGVCLRAAALARRQQSATISTSPVSCGLMDKLKDKLEEGYGGVKKAVQDHLQERDRKRGDAMEKLIGARSFREHALNNPKGKQLPPLKAVVVPRADGYVDHGLEVAGAGIGLMEHEVCEVTKSSYNHALTPTEAWETGHASYNSFANKLLGGAFAFALAGLATLWATGYFSLPYAFYDYKTVKIDPRGPGAEIKEDEIPFSNVAYWQAKLLDQEPSMGAKEGRILELAHAGLSEEDFIGKVKAENLLDLVIAQAEAKGDHELAEEARRAAAEDAEDE